MAKRKPTLKSLGQILDQAHRLYAAGRLEAAGQQLNQFKADAEAVLDEQQEAMTREMNYHLRLRRDLTDLTGRAATLSREVKAKQGGGDE